MFWFLFLFGLALGAEIPSDDHEVKLQQGDCPMTWFSFNDRCYKYIATDKTWADAELHCMSENANLVSILGPKEQNFVQNLIKNFDSAQGRTWIGFSDLHKEGSWMWSDGSIVNYTFWAKSQPDNKDPGQHCAIENYGSQLKWDDQSCSVTYPFVCKSRA